MSLDLICKEMTPYPHWTMEVYSGVGAVAMVAVTCSKFELTAEGRTEQEAAEKMLKRIQKRKFENVT